MARYKLSPGEFRTWNASDPATRSEARARVRRIASGRASLLQQPFVIVTAPDGAELERVYRGLVVELDERETRIWLGRDPFARELLRRRFLRVCRDWLEADEKLDSIDVRAANGDLLDRIDRAAANGRVPEAETDANRTGRRLIASAERTTDSFSRKRSGRG